jgi:hypothetical protein
MFEDTKGVIRSNNSKNEQYMAKRKRTKRHRMVHKTLQRKLTIEQHDHTKNGGALEGQTSTILKSISKMTIL